MYGNPYYQPYFPTPQPQPQAQNSNGLVWVQGEAGAKSFLVAPGQSVLLMDSEGQRFYLKSADPSGMPSLRVFEYTERTASTPAPAPSFDPSQYVTREELENRIATLLNGAKGGGVTNG